MYYYKIFNLIIASDLYFCQLIPASEENVSVTITSGDVLSQIPAHSEQTKYEIGMKFSWLENNTCYLLVRDGNYIEYQLKPNGNPDYLRTYLLGWGMSLLGLERGEPAIHCSAVSCDNEAVLFCGESGSGKSTLTRSYLEHGYLLMADDMAFLEYIEPKKVQVKPAFPYQKLCRDAALQSGHSLEEMIYIDEDKDKFLVPCHDIFDNEIRPLKAIFLLAKGNVDSVEVHQISGLDSFHACVNNLFLRHLLKEQKYEPAIAQQCLKIASAVPIYLLIRPTEADTTQEIFQLSMDIIHKTEEL